MIMINMAAIIASQTAMRISSQVACEQMRKRQKQREEDERKKKEQKK